MHLTCFQSWGRVEFIQIFHINSGQQHIEDGHNLTPQLVISIRKSFLYATQREWSHLCIFEEYVTGVLFAPKTIIEKWMQSRCTGGNLTKTFQNFPSISNECRLFICIYRWMRQPCSSVSENEKQCKEEKTSAKLACSARCHRIFSHQYISLMQAISCSFLPRGGDVTFVVYSWRQL